MSGFRVRSEVYFLNETVPKKYYIFLNKSKWTRINDVRNHIKTIFEIECDFEVYIDGMLLPGNETIDLIQQDDTLVIKILKSSNQVTHNDSDVEIIGSFFRSKRPKSKKKEYKKNKNEDEDESLQLLNRKRTILNSLKSISASSDVDDEEKIIVNNESVTLTNDDIINDADFVPPKKKRKRKHKKKVKLIDNSNIDNSEVVNCITDEELKPEELTSLFDVSKSDSSQRHTFFSDEIDEPHCSKEAHSTPDEDAVRADIRTRLTQLANKPKSEKVFERKRTSNENISQRDDTCSHDSPDKNQSSIDIDISTPIVEQPRLGDTITFTKLKIGENYCPEPSGSIVGKVLRVHIPPDNPDQFRVTLNILKGWEEFQVPEGKFSLEQENHSSNGIPQIHVAEIYWHEVIEPRLLKAADTNSFLNNLSTIP